jgi:hypothetical protein
MQSTLQFVESFTELAHAALPRFIGGQIFGFGQGVNVVEFETALGFDTPWGKVFVFHRFSVGTLI